MPTTRRSAAIALSLALATAPLAACAGQAAPTSPSATTSAATSGTTSAALDVASWKTLGDAVAHATDSPSYADDGSVFVCAFKAGDRFARVVCEPQEGLDSRLAPLDISSSTYVKDFAQAMGDLKLQKAEDVTSQLLSQQQLDALVGKTLQELLDEGFVFESYFMYGGEQTGAQLGKDCFSYTLTFDAKVSEAEAEAGQATPALLGGKMVEGQYTGFSNAALDPSAA